MPQTTKKTRSGVATRQTTLQTPSGVIAAYEAFPTKAGPWPAVVVVHEAWGLNDDIRRIADRFAAAGYLAVAPDLVEGGRLRCLVRAFRDLQRQGGATFADLQATVDLIAQDRRVADGRVGVVGFCLGGGFALLAGTLPAVRAVAANYGRVPDDDTLSRLCPVVASYGAEDRAFRSQAERLNRVLQQVDIDHDVRVYPGAGHSFMNQDGPRIVRVLSRITAVGYHPEAAEDAWRRIVDFFSKHV